MVTKNEILDAVSKLPDVEQAEIADRVLGNLMDKGFGQTGNPMDAQKAWGEEIQSRLADYRSGRVKGIPADEAHRMMFDGDHPEI
jgi:putative addiction module component (TIGR02574 family)